MRTSAGPSILFVAVLLCALAFALPAAAGVDSVTIDGDQAVAELSVAGVEATLTLTFEDTVGLTEQNLGLSVAQINPLDPLLLARLPTLTSLPTGLPMLIRIEPPFSGGLTFDGMVEVEIYTHALSYSVGCPFRLFSAPLGGDFQDITDSLGGGSYRVRGGKGEFSEFLVVVEARAVDTVIAAKLSRLDGLLSTYGSQIDHAVLDDLEELLDSAEKSYDDGNLLPAIKKVEAFISKVESHSGDDVPDVWRSARDLDNVAGLLRAGAETLHFSLTWKYNGL